MPKKQHIFFIFTIILLFLLLLWLIKSENNGNEAYNIAVTDTASINKIFIADMTGNSISLDREKNTWRIDNTYKVQNKTMETILKTIKDIVN